MPSSPSRCCRSPSTSCWACSPIARGCARARGRLQMIFGLPARRHGVHQQTYAAMLFSGISGTAVSDIASLGRAADPAHDARRLPAHVQCGADSGDIDHRRPLSRRAWAMIIYALAVGNISVGAMFAGAMIPGIMMGAGLHARCRGTRRARAATAASFPRRAHASSGGRRSSVRRSSSCRSSSSEASSAALHGGPSRRPSGTAYTVLVGLVRKPRLRMKDIYDATRVQRGDQLGGRDAARRRRDRRVDPHLQPRHAVRSPTCSSRSRATRAVFMLIVMLALLFLGMLMDAVPIMICSRPAPRLRSPSSTASTRSSSATSSSSRA